MWISTRDLILTSFIHSFNFNPYTSKSYGCGCRRLRGTKYTRQRKLTLLEVVCTRENESGISIDEFVEERKGKVD